MNRRHARILLAALAAALTAVLAAAAAPAAVTRTVGPDWRMTARPGWALPKSAQGSAVKSVILQWNGTKWSLVPSPNPVPPSTFLRGVAATSPANAWAAGYGGPLDGAGSTVILHWNGTAWSATKSPNP